MDVDTQEELGYRIFRRTPFNHYARKNIGYLYAIGQGAELIADVDDDNIPYSDWDRQSLSEMACLPAITSRDSQYLQAVHSANIWPRGLPLEAILDETPLELDEPRLATDRCLAVSCRRGPGCGCRLPADGQQGSLLREA